MYTWCLMFVAYIVYNDCCRILLPFDREFLLLHFCYPQTLWFISPKTWTQKQFMNGLKGKRRVRSDTFERGNWETGHWGTYILKATQSAESAFSVSKILRKKCVNRDNKISRQKCVNNKNHKNLVSRWYFCWEYSVFWCFYWQSIAMTEHK